MKMRDRKYQRAEDQSLWAAVDYAVNIIKMNTREMEMWEIEDICLDVADSEGVDPGQLSDEVTRRFL